MNVLSPLVDAAWAERIGWTLVHSVWQVALVAAVYAVLVFVLRRGAASSRYMSGCAALVAMVVLPAVTLVRMPMGSSADNLPAVVQASVEPDGGRVTAEATAVETPLASINAPAPQRPPVSPPNDDFPLGTLVAVRLSSWHGRLALALSWLTAGWLVGVTVLAIRPLWGLLVVRRLKTRGLAPLPAELRKLAGHLMMRLHVDATVQFAESALVKVPTVVGFVRPMVLLPASAVTGLSTEQLELILAHELAHVRRHDYLVNLVQTTIEALLFYHPGMWWVSAVVRRERENCCDDVAIRICGNRGQYIRALYELESQRQSAAPALAASGGSLVHRTRRLVLGRQTAAGVDRSTAWFAGLIALSIVAAVLSLGQLYAEDRPADTSDDASRESASEETSADNAANVDPPTTTNSLPPLPTLEAVSDQKLLLRQIDEALEEIERRGGGHVIVGRVLVEGDDNPTHVKAQMEILGGGFFAGRTRDLERPVGFRLHGYAPFDLKLAGRSGQVVDVGTIQMRRLPEEETVPVVGRVVLEDGGDLSGVAVRFSIDEGPVNTPSGGTSPRPDRPDPIEVELDSVGRFYQTGFSPAEYYLSVTAPGYVKQTRRVDFPPGGIVNLDTIRLEKPWRIEVDYIATQELPFELDQTKHTVLQAGARWQMTPHPHRYDLEFKQQDHRLRYDWSYGRIMMAALGPGELSDYLNIDGSAAIYPPNHVPVVNDHVYLVRRPNGRGEGSSYALVKLHIDGYQSEVPTHVPKPGQQAGAGRPDPSPERPSARATEPRPSRPAPPPDINKLDEDGFSQLHRAASGGHVARVRRLLEQGADPDVEQGTYHGTPLQYAASQGHGEVVQVLLEHSATVDARDTHQRTPLIWASMNGDADVIRRLLDAGANIGATNQGGWTPLHYAVDKGHVEASQLLIDRGADIHAKNSHGQTPVDLNPKLNLRIPWRALHRPSTSDGASSSSARSPAPSTPPQREKPAAQAQESTESSVDVDSRSGTDVVAEVRGKPVLWRDIAPTAEWYKQRAEYQQKHGHTRGYESPDDYALGRLRRRIMQSLIDQYKREHNLGVTEDEIKTFIARFREIQRQRGREHAAEFERLQQEVADARQRATLPNLSKAEYADLQRQIEAGERQLKELELLAGPQWGDMKTRAEQFFAQWYVGHWKLQQSLYKKYGGRAIWQQVGPEALDAMRDLLKEKESEGFFKIHDPELRERFWGYYVNDKMHIFLDDPDRIFEHPWSPFEEPNSAGDEPTSRQDD